MKCMILSTQQFKNNFISSLSIILMIDHVTTHTCHDMSSFHKLIFLLFILLSSHLLHLPMLTGLLPPRWRHVWPQLWPWNPRQHLLPSGPGHGRQWQEEAQRQKGKKAQRQEEIWGFYRGAGQEDQKESIWTITVRDSVIYWARRYF